MAIESPRISGKPTFPRAEVRINCVAIITGVYAQWTPDENVGHVFNPNTLQYDFLFIKPSEYEEGTLFFSPTPGSPSGRLYVVVVDPATLNKKIVSTSASVFYSSTTSKLFDPLAVFYDPLAS